MKFEGYDSWVSIFDAATVEEAMIVKGMLESLKIPVAIERDSVGDAFGLASSVSSDVIVKVPKDMVSKASQLLQAKQFGARQE